jgi:hypothetical protein
LQEVQREKINTGLQIASPQIMVEILKWVSYEFNNEAVERVILWGSHVLDEGN